MNTYRPLLAITMGDPAGAGPEIVVKSLKSPEIQSLCRALVIGDAGVMRAAAEIVGIPMEIHSVATPGEMKEGEDVMNVLDLKDVDLSTLVRGKVSAAAGKAAYEAIEKGTMLTLDRLTDAIVTSALNKDALNQAGYHFPGHTQILAHLCGVRDAVMMLTADNLRIVHVSTHVSLRQACDLVTKERILRVMQLGVEATRAMGVEKPRVVVPGLNPHSGEGGLFGTEEETQIIPAIEEAKALGIDVRGPLPPDTAFLRAFRGEFDLVIAMYHDQGHIPIKMVGFEKGVNVTLGLPIIRTSVDHGTVFGKAGKGTADPTSMIEAIKLAATMCRTAHRPAQG
ncbi:MAG: 4-hydroxythreonine-4-phosphate dehydrogenase PdxA [Dehalococcoidia bacterium]|nr:4-hydroxythreonine-4-phosphate dehydrogenase PdxA [Dehalococcoidia bacterium]